jgi:hypothetical protein
LKSEIDYLLSTRAIRERSLKLFEATERGRTHFVYHPEKLDEVAEFVVAVTRKNYPDLKIPFHSRWGHFKAGGVDRVERDLMPRLKGMSREEIARVKLDLAVVSVLLDAGAGDAWKFNEPSTGVSIGRSEGLAVASFWMFIEGAFSHDRAKPLQVTSQGLRALTRDKLEKGFQVSAGNPLVGVEGRLSLLHSLAGALERNREIFSQGRPGNIFDYVKSIGAEVPAVRLLRAVLDGLGPIWPGRIQAQGVNLGDCWRHRLLGDTASNESLIPFHKLSQWLTYSLIEPIEEGGVKITAVQEMTGLPEYRNGGLLLDRGLLSLRDPAARDIAHEPGSELIVEWRALTIVLLDRIATQVRAKLGLSEEQFPLAKVLEGGTWWAGRAAAKELRANGAPPLQLKSDGTVF